MMNIVTIDEFGLGYQAGLRAGDTIISINDHPVTDILDYRYLVSEDEIDVVFERDGSRHNILVLNENYEDLGIEFEPMHFKCCGNKCIFCFIDQNPKGLRSSLYFKD